MKELGTPVGKNIVKRLLWDEGYRRRKPKKMRTMGQHADRNAQFENIAKLKQQHLDAGQPVISMDTKKKEMLGNFYREGVTDGVEPTIVNDHDFTSSSNGTVIPHGIYDVAKNKASVHLNCSKDTSQFACESIELWFNEQGRHDYPEATELLILCDGRRQQQFGTLHLQRRLAEAIEPIESSDSHLSLSTVLLKVQSDRAPRVPARHACL